MSMDCHFCHRSFSKGEHLRRHERSHTGAKPFSCRVCQRSFSRQDSLARHEKLHARSRRPRRHSAVQTLRSSTQLPPTRETVSRDDAVDNDVDTSVLVPPSDHAVDGNTATAITDAQPSADITVPELDFDLIWPDSEDLFQSLMSTETTDQWHGPLGTLPFSAPPSVTDHGACHWGTPRSFDERPPSIGTIPSGGNHQAVQDVSNMVSNQSSTVTAAAKSNAITSVFLDECLHMFFVKFIPTFPVLHRATFVFKDCSHPLLLNAIAIGSLYLGPKDALAKGEALWRLAHTAMATSWPTLITHRGPYDKCEGVQLVVTAVLNQVYGALSRNRAIRSTSQAFHSLGFVWARRCGMFDTPPFSADTVPSPDAPDYEKRRRWRCWAAREIQLRALLAHYTIDGLISHMSGVPTSTRHATNPLALPSHEVIFEAASADEWVDRMHAYRQTGDHLHNDVPSFRAMLKSLFQPAGPSPRIHPCLSAFSYKVLLEGLQSLISDDDSDAGSSAVGVPSRLEVRHALNEIYHSLTLNTTLGREDRLETLLRWHALCLDTAVDPTYLCRSLCARYDVPQHIWPRRGPGRGLLDLAHWVTTRAARVALLHAMAIQEIVEQLPRGRAHTIYMPSSLFAASTVYSIFALAGAPTLRIPCSVVWPDAMDGGSPPPPVPAPPSADPRPSLHAFGLPDSSQLSSPTSASVRGSIGGDTDTARYVRGEVLDATTGTWRNMLYELNSMHKLFRCLIAQWGVALDMESVVEKWISLCH